MVTQTTYYEFNKPAGSDLVNPLVDTNPNWDKADAALHGLSVNSIGTAVEVITLGVHALTRVAQPDSKFFVFIATGDFDAGETFTLDGVAISAALPDGSALGSDCYVTGACVLVGLNADNTLATFYLPSTGATAPDSLRLGGELPSYYATAAALANAVQSITDLDNIMGNTSISGIGDGTATGAINAINADLVNKEDKHGIVSVTANGVKTYQALLNELYALVDTTKITSKTHLLINTPGVSKANYPWFYETSASEIFAATGQTSVNEFSSNQITVGLTSDFNIVSRTGVRTSFNSTVPVSGVTITIYY